VIGKTPGSAVAWGKGAFCLGVIIVRRLCVVSFLIWIHFFVDWRPGLFVRHSGLLVWWSGHGSFDASHCSHFGLRSLCLPRKKQFEEI